MFFSLSKDPDYRFPHIDTIGDWYFGHDNGWKNIEAETWFKGYRHRSIDYGCWTEIKKTQNRLIINHPLQRGYPLWWDPASKILSNLSHCGTPIWADNVVFLTDDGLEFGNAVVDAYSQESEFIPKARALERICDNLQKKFSACLEDINIRKKIFPTGGLDSTTVLAVLSYLDADIDVIDYEHFEYDPFTNKNIKHIKKIHWAYRQIHHWREATVLFSGASGDPTMIRHPIIAGTWCAWKGIDLCHVLESRYGYNSFNLLSQKDSIIQLFDNRKELTDKFPEYKDLVRHLLSMIANDYQHWHLGNTLTWTPFMDTEISKVILSMDTNDILDQIISGTFNKSLIEFFNPEMLGLLSDHKNDIARQNLDNVKDVFYRKSS